MEPPYGASLNGRRGQPGRPSAGMSATRRDVYRRDTRPALPSTVVLRRPASIPDAPGSYQFKDQDGRVIYVGKARSLRSRLGNYFQDPSGLHARTAQMMERA